MMRSRRALWLLVLLQGLALIGLATLLLLRPLAPDGGARPAGRAVGPVADPDDDHRVDRRQAAGPASAGAPAASGGGADADSTGTEGTVRLDREVQRASGLAVAPVSAAAAPETDASWGEVVATRGLTEARQRLLQSAADLDQAGLQLERARQECARLEAVFNEGGNVALKTVEQARSDLALAEQHHATLAAQRVAARDVVRADWGTGLLDALARSDAGVLAPVLDGRQVLVLAPAGTGARGWVAPAGQPGARIAAERTAAAVQALGSTAAPTWYWRAAASGLRSGERVRLYAASAPPQSPLAGGGGSGAGVRVPEDAVVWQAGQAWVFVQRDAEHFERHAIELGAPLPGAWFVRAGLTPGTPIVTRGAQLLLSEASKALIRNENGD